MTYTASCHFCLGFLRPVGAQEKSFSKLIISYVARIYKNKGENISVFFVWCDWIYQICRQAIYAWLLLTLGYISRLHAIFYSVMFQTYYFSLCHACILWYSLLWHVCITRYFLLTCLFYFSFFHSWHICITWYFTLFHVCITCYFSHCHVCLTCCFTHNIFVLNGVIHFLVSVMQTLKLLLLIL